jgi:hypothetical protein
LKAPPIILQVHIHAFDRSVDLRKSISTSKHDNDIGDDDDDDDDDDGGGYADGDCDDDVNSFFNASLSDGSKEDSLAFIINIKCS